MIPALLAAQASPVEAERAFAADAQRLGQWTAFRKWAAPDAVIFVPEPVKVQDRLNDPYVSSALIEWTPAESFVSCDGTLAVNTGEKQQPDGSDGYFTTVWKRQADGTWRWLFHHWDRTETPRARVHKPTIRRAHCSRPNDNRPFRVHRFAGLASSGISSDGTIAFRWRVNSTDKPLPRSLEVVLWTDEGWQSVLTDDVSRTL